MVVCQPTISVEDNNCVLILSQDVNVTCIVDSRRNFIASDFVGLPVIFCKTEDTSNISVVQYITRSICTLKNFNMNAGRLFAQSVKL